MPLVSIVMLATSRTSSSRWPFADSSMCSDTLAPLKIIVSVPLRPSTVSLPSPGFQTNESSPLPRMTVSFPRPASTESFPDPPRIVSAPEPPTRLSSPLPPSIVVGMVSVKTPSASSMRTCVVAGAAVDVDAGDVGAGEAEDGRAVVDVDLQDARIAGLQAERDRVAVGRALDRQGTVFQLGLLEAVCRGVALRSDEPGHAGEGGRGRRQSSQMVHVFLLSSVCRDGRGSRPSLAPWATPCLFRPAANTGGSPRCERPPRRRTMDAMLDPRLRQLYSPQLADRNRLEARQARRITLGARRRYELELQRRPSLEDVRRPRAERRPRLAVVAVTVTVIAAVVVLAVVLAASAGAV